VIPGQISIVGFSRFIFRISCGKLVCANVRFPAENALATFHAMRVRSAEEP
jgi:hypothetical protein